MSAPLAWRSCMGVPPDHAAGLDKWHVWASEQLYSGRRFYTAHVKRWSADGLYSADAYLPFEYPTLNAAEAAARHYIIFLLSHEQ